MSRSFGTASQSWFRETCAACGSAHFAVPYDRLRRAGDLRRFVPPGLGRRRKTFRWFRSGGNPVSRPAHVTAILAWTYLAVVLLLLALLRLAGDRWWVATVFTFGPRWIALLPAPIVFVLSAIFHRRSFFVLAASLGLALGPVMGFCFGWRTWLTDAGDSAERKLRIISYNAGAGGRDSAFVDLVKTVKPDVIALMEWGARPLPPELGKDWHVRYVAATTIASRFPIVYTEALESERLGPWNRPAGRSNLVTPWGPINLLSVHLETPREGLAEVRWSLWRGKAEMLHTTKIRRTESELSSRLTDSAPGPWIIAGDFNMPVDSAIYQKYWSRWNDAFSMAGFGYGYTKFTSTWGVRIDHILAGDEWNVLAAWVGPDLGGDHRPVIADLQLRRR